jgi:large subunit ribosomal protein L9
MPEGPFKAIGDYSVVLSLHTDVTANITVSVLGEH